jgi:hypothetical protein
VPAVRPPDRSRAVPFLSVVRHSISPKLSAISRQLPA